MFKAKAQEKLPTFLQYLKAEEIEEYDNQWPVVAVLWGDQWKSITFKTAFFRYTVKFNTEAEYREATNAMTDAITAQGQVRTRIDYSAEEGDVEVHWLDPHTDSDIDLMNVSSFQWGLALGPSEALRPSAPAKQKKPAAKKAAPPAKQG